MRGVILTFLLTSLLWWAVFTYMAYNRDELSLAEEIESVEEQSVSEYKEPRSSDVVVEKSEKVAEKQPVKKAAPATSAKGAPAKEAVSAPKQESVAKNLTSGQSVSQPQSAEAVAPSLDISQEIIGKWKPVEGAENPLEFTKYGAVIQTVYGDINMRSDYKILGDKMKIRYDDATFKIIKEGNATYLEIYNSTDFSGRYRRVSQPAKINASIIDKSEYSTYIVGRWTPITGQENPIEFTKFNTVIQYVYGTIDMRSDYSLNNDKLSIRYDKSAKVVISEDANNYYLEIFNTTDFSGRYKKAK